MTGMVAATPDMTTLAPVARLVGAAVLTTIGDALVMLLIGIVAGIPEMLTLAPVARPVGDDVFDGNGRCIGNIADTLYISGGPHFHGVRTVDGLKHGICACRREIDVLPTGRTEASHHWGG